MSATSSVPFDFTPSFSGRPPSFSDRPAATEISRASLWTGRVVTGVISILLAMDSALKVFVLTPAVEATAQLGYPAGIVFPLGIYELVSLVLYLVPRTSILGAVLWTGYLGGAVATHVRLDNPLFTHTLSPIYVAIMLWGGLWLRDRRLRNVFARVS
jgi:DoxX-like family